jgi:transcriptional regulator with XRE-family HTH domain
MRRDLFVTRILARRMLESSHLAQDDLADALDVDRSHISHQLSGRYRLDANELHVWCQMLDTDEPIDAICRRRGGRFVRDDKPVTKASDFLRSFNALLRDAGLAGGKAGKFLEDGHLCESERIQLHRQLDLVRETVESIQAGLGVRAVAGRKPLRGAKVK